MAQTHTDERIARIAALARGGFSADSVADMMRIDKAELMQLVGQSKEAEHAIRAGEEAYLTVQDAMLRLSTGYTARVTKHFKEIIREYDPANGKKVREIETPVARVDEVHVPPSVTAAAYWLKTMRPEDWENASTETRIIDTVRELLAQIDSY